MLTNIIKYTAVSFAELPDLHHTVPGSSHFRVELAKSELPNESEICVLGTEKQPWTGRSSHTQSYVTRLMPNLPLTLGRDGNADSNRSAEKQVSGKKVPGTNCSW